MDAKDAALAAVNGKMDALTIHTLRTFAGTPEYPYFVGAYREEAGPRRPGRVDAQMTLTGWDERRHWAACWTRRPRQGGVGNRAFIRGTGR